MRLAFSNIAWDRTEDEEIARLLNKCNIDAIDIAPSKYFSNLKSATQSEINGIKKWWSARGIEIIGMQALMYGTNGLNLFGSQEIQTNMLEHLATVCRIGATLGARWLVFGSPKNRDRANLSDDQAEDIALAFFQRLGEIAESYGVTICLEPNPPVYGANFLTNTVDTLRFVKKTSHQAIRMQLDTGAITLNNENSEEVIKGCAEFVGHIHASEPNLVPLGDTETRHQDLALSIHRYLHEKVVSIEMLATKNESHISSIERALTIAKRYYQHEP